MRIPFTKMHGIGNDFVLLDGTAGALARHPEALCAEVVSRLGDRHEGVGFDQLLVAERTWLPGAQIAMRVFNTDGSVAGQCGNGLRCFARFVRARDLVAATEFVVEVAGAPATVRLLAHGRVCAELAAPGLDPADVRILETERAVGYALYIGCEEYRVGAVSMGNPHVVLQVDDVDAAPVTTLGPRIQRHEKLPDSANVGFMQVLARDHVRLRVFERGVGETRACGSGACAAVVVGRLQGSLDETVAVDLSGGRLNIGWKGAGRPVEMTGPTATVFEGELDL